MAKWIFGRRFTAEGAETAEREIDKELTRNEIGCAFKARPCRIGASPSGGFRARVGRGRTGSARRYSGAEWALVCHVYRTSRAHAQRGATERSDALRKCGMVKAESCPLIRTATAMERARGLTTTGPLVCTRGSDQRAERSLQIVRQPRSAQGFTSLFHPNRRSSIPARLGRGLKSTAF